MTSALVVEGSPPADIDLAADLAAAGVRVLGATPRSDLVREAVRTSPDVIVCHEVSPDETLFAAFALLAETAPCPAVVFTHDPEAAKIERALAAGIHSYVVNGYSAERLRAVLQVARSRFEQERRVRAELIEVTRRFDERKLVDRAKGILMRARQVSEEEAFAVLRAASMHSNQRVGQVSRQVIAAAHYADAVNRAGKLRMLSQRLVKACALRVLDRGGAAHADQVDDATRQIDASIAALAKSVSKPTFGDLLDAVATAWAELQTLAAPALTAGGLAALDAAAERLLLQAEKGLTAASRPPARGRRFTSSTSRGASACCRSAMRRRRCSAWAWKAPHAARAELARTAETFEQSLAHLRAIPLCTGEIRALLEDAERVWQEVAATGRQVGQASGARSLDAASDALLALFEQLTDRYERSMQVLMG